jgi:DNA-binding MarR family transcriptional regulator/N-acetylglutamate synthase-like GNAT family acetyltransferase
MQDILASHGPVFLGSRLKRLAERLQSDAAAIIQAHGMPIQPSQFPLLAALDRHGPLTVGQAVDALGISQPAVTRALAGLVELRLVEVERTAADQRHKLISLSPAGRALVDEARETLWPRVGAAVSELSAGLSGSLLEQIAGLERALAECSLDRRVADAAASGLRILDYSDALAGEFLRINAEWIEAMFTMEPADREVLENPREAIIDRGGAVLFVEAGELGSVGTCALNRTGPGAFELTKMAVLERARGRRAGGFLLAAAIERARALRARSLYLLTNRRCAAAIHLYERAGFVHDPEIMRTYGARYERADVAMRYAAPLA